MAGEFVQVIVGNLIGIVIFGMILTGLIKTLRMSTDVAELKEMVKEMQRESRLMAALDANAGRDQASTLALSSALSGQAQLDRLSREEAIDPLQQPEKPVRQP
jgi:hypothetical protein